MTTPPIRKICDRSYELLGDVDEAISFLNLLFNYMGAGKATDLYQHRWRHDGPEGRTMIVLFKPNPPGSPPRLSLLGPKLAVVDRLVALEEVAP